MKTDLISTAITFQIDVQFWPIKKSICGVFWVSMKPKVEKYDRSKGSLGPAGDNLNIRLKQSQSHRRWQNFFNKCSKVKRDLECKNT